MKPEDQLYAGLVMAEYILHKRAAARDEVEDESLDEAAG